MNKLISLFVAIFLLLTSCVTKDPPKTKIKNKILYKDAKFAKGEIAKLFYYIRHGQTDSNKFKLSLGNVPLNAEGKLQAEKAATRLRNKGIKIIVASPLLPTKKTAEISSNTESPFSS